jgi:hypothetical protein
MTRTLIIGQLHLVIEALAFAMDAAFDELFAAYYEQKPPSWDAFDRASREYFDHHQSPAEHNHYFNCFTVIWKDLLAQNRLLEAEKLWQRASPPRRSPRAAGRTRETGESPACTESPVGCAHTPGC